MNHAVPTARASGETRQHRTRNTKNVVPRTSRWFVLRCNVQRHPQHPSHRRQLLVAPLRSMTCHGHTSIASATYQEQNRWVANHRNRDAQLAFVSAGQRPGIPVHDTQQNNNKNKRQQSGHATCSAGQCLPVQAAHLCSKASNCSSRSFTSTTVFRNPTGTPLMRANLHSHNTHKARMSTVHLLRSFVNNNGASPR